MSFRIEEKIPMTVSDSNQFLQSLKDQGLEILFPKRAIQSNYFDSSNYSLYRDSEEGLLPRKKIRIRHYPQAASIQQNLEIKISSIEGRHKNSIALSDIKAKRINKLGYFDPVYGLLEKKVSICYLREYFLFQGIRITRDSKILYQELGHKSNYYFEKDSVVEIKASKNTSVDFLLKIIPSQRRRFSKYCNAIKYLKMV
ncbi:VTC domain-containing protein [bacterium]|jgi:hypothetical protein|nr:VTC domain-containing protein [bacterium]